MQQFHWHSHHHRMGAFIYSPPLILPLPAASPDAFPLVLNSPRAFPPSLPPSLPRSPSSSSPPSSPPPHPAPPRDDAQPTTTTTPTETSPSTTTSTTSTTSTTATTATPAGTPSTNHRTCAAAVRSSVSSSYDCWTTPKTTVNCPRPRGGRAPLNDSPVPDGVTWLSLGINRARTCFACDPSPHSLYARSATDHSQIPLGTFTNPSPSVFPTLHLPPAISSLPFPRPCHTTRHNARQRWATTYLLKPPALPPPPPWNSAVLPGGPISRACTSRPSSPRRNAAAVMHDRPSDSNQSRGVQSPVQRGLC